MSAGAKALRTQRDLSMDGLMPRCQGWQGAAHLQKAQRFCVLGLAPSE
ncbi:hypothetical protein [Desulfosporosinus sp. Sb-LF]|nr:hypothetical protein [Desulfosporosinus sp. Sb-LF]